jgi:hypothetical protein
MISGLGGVGTTSLDPRGTKMDSSLRGFSTFLKKLRMLPLGFGAGALGFFALRFAADDMLVFEFARGVSALLRDAMTAVDLERGGGGGALLLGGGVGGLPTDGVTDVLLIEDDDTFSLGFLNIAACGYSQRIGIRPPPRLGSE